MRGDAADAGAYGERDLDHLIEGRLVAGGAQSAIIFLAVDGLERGAHLEHAAAAGAKYVPRQLKNSEPRSVQKGGDRALLVEAALGREGERIDPAEVAVQRVAYRLFNCGSASRVGRLPQDAEKGLGFAHRKLSLAL